ncbi:META domain-containing protein [Cryobacterium sp. 1639]|uniref:META domain-containing protein n=1 Tax=Cryobacterium inferilacus TaxID=2866629 RepID=UPI001C73BB88|nr:META domain-containing protein [Cryobacterium sp. 1639]MBX0300890.1 META domain-containing protein [Cryobacterium sp. 1639]
MRNGVGRNRAGTARFRHPTLALLCAAALLLTGCASDPAGSSPPVGPGSTAESTSIGLVNVWRVSGVADEEPHTWLRFDAHEFQLWRDCGPISGSWRATDTLFLAYVNSATDECVPGASLPELPWLESVTGYRPAGDGWDLTGADGAVLASLTIDGTPDPIPTVIDSLTEPPPITAEVRAALARPAAAPADATPATAEDLAGRWVPVGFDDYTDPHALFEADGTWSGSDGCNGNAGRWVVDPSGTILTTGGMSTAMGCAGELVPSWVIDARVAVLDDDRLRLLDADGAELGVLERG